MPPEAPKDDPERQERHPHCRIGEEPQAGDPGDDQNDTHNENVTPPHGVEARP